MTSFRVFDIRFRSLGMRVLGGTLACLLLSSNPAVAQSTFASVVGPVRDASGAVVAKCRYFRRLFRYEPGTRCLLHRWILQ
jgi:hypothetical protein